MAEIIDLDFYRKFRIILPVRPNTPQQHTFNKQSYLGPGQQTKRFRRKRKIELDSKATKKD